MNKPKAKFSSYSSSKSLSLSAYRQRSVNAPSKSRAEKNVRKIIKDNRDKFLYTRDHLDCLVDLLPQRLEDSAELCGSLAKRVASGYSVDKEQIKQMELSLEKLKDYSKTFELKERLSREGFEARDELAKVIDDEKRRIGATRGSSGRDYSATRGSIANVRDHRRDYPEEDKENQVFKHPRIHF
uniref:Uncharacterized protein n=1 Tax=Panagrolaimus sp. ES5 TaxID=591445 RepID=A0AC34GFQ2_9BILA